LLKAEGLTVDGLRHAVICTGQKLNTFERLTFLVLGYHVPAFDTDSGQQVMTNCAWP